MQIYLLDIYSFIWGLMCFFFLFFLGEERDSYKCLNVQICMYSILCYCVLISLVCILWLLSSIWHFSYLILLRLSSPVKNLGRTSHRITSLYIFLICPVRRLTLVLHTFLFWRIYWITFLPICCEIAVRINSGLFWHPSKCIKVHNEKRGLGDFDLLRTSKLGTLWRSTIDYVMKWYSIYLWRRIQPARSI